MKSSSVGSSSLILLLLLLICSAILGGAITRASAQPNREPVVNGSGLQPRKHKHHHLLLLIGGLKSIAAVVLIKIKIILVVAVLVAVVVYTVKYLLGGTGLFYKGLVAQPPILMPGFHQHPQPIESHESFYGPYGYQTAIPWDVSHEGPANRWSKLGDGGRSMFDIHRMYPKLGQTLVENSFKHRRKRKRNINGLNM